MRKVLIVDDNTVNLRILNNILKNDYEVLEAENGEDALKILRSSRGEISAVLLDLVMPKMNGYEVLDVAAGDSLLSQIPIIVMTGSGEFGSEEKALSLGAIDYILKPYNPKVIERRLKNTIRLRETAALVNALKTDSLTGLYSRSAFISQAENLISKQPAGYYTIECFNINGFKAVNEQYGNAKGDDVLRFIANTFRKNFDEKGAIVGRIMADNFAVLFPSDSFGDGELEKIHTAAANLDGSILPIRYSVGLYKIEDISLPVSAMYDRASIARDFVKGRYDTHIAEYDEAMLQRILREQEITSEMKIALENRDFEVWFQPQYNHSSGALIGSEALVRWRHPIKGLISPGIFIPVFEKNGFIYELDKYVWERACACLRRWIDDGRSPLPVSVNISRYDIFRDDLVDVLVGIIKKYELNVELLRLEITESAFATSTEQIITVVKKLISLGFTLEIDDFGSGYSSLNTLKDVPADVLKLDMRFLENDENSQRGGNILESMVRMAKWLGMSVIAEGVETVEQANYLESIGCIYIQGYLYARPMPEEEYESLFGNERKEERLLTLQTVNTLDNSAFWDPKSMDTLIFNSYVGGACVFEFHNNNIEMLRANDKCAEVLSDGSCKVTISDALKISWKDALDSDNLTTIHSAIKYAIDTRKEATCEIACNHLLGNKKTIYLRVAIRIIASAGTRYLIYCTSENITAQHEAEESERNIAQQLQAIMDSINGGVSVTVVNGDDVRFLFANNLYYNQLGYTREQFEAEVKTPFNLILEKDRERVKAQTKRANRFAQPFSVAYRFKRRDGSTGWMESNVSVMNYPGINEPVQLAVANDITTKKEYEQRLIDTDEQLKFLNNTAHELLAEKNSDLGIENVLKKTLDYFDGNRAYIIELIGDSLASNTYEICAEGIKPQKDMLQDMPLDVASFWFDAFEDNSYICIENVNDLPDNREDEKQLLMQQGIKSLIAVPLRRDKKLIGFLGIDDPRQHKQRIDRLNSIGDYIAVMLTRRDLETKIENEKNTLALVMNDTPGGFLRLHVTENETLTAVYANDGFCKLVGLSKKKLIELYKNDIMSAVHPDDIKHVKKCVHRVLTTGKALSFKYRLSSGYDSYIYLFASCKATTDKFGEIYLNVYYTDIDEESKSEKQRRELIENLPCGAGIFKVQDGNILGLYFNKRYMELVGRKIDTENEYPSVLDVIHTNDKSEFLRAINAGIQNGKSVEHDVRIRCSNGEYRPFRFSGNIVENQSGEISLYATYTPIFNEDVTFHDMFPKTFEAMMRASSDIAFVKDRNLKYICCSKAFTKFTNTSDETQIIGRTDFDILGKTYAEKYTSEDREILESGVPILNYIEQLPTESGEMRYAITSKYPMYDSFGNIIGIYGTGHDITEERAAYSKLKTLTDSINGGIASYECTRDSVTLVSFNDAFCKMLGYTHSEYELLVRNGATSLVYEEDLPIIRGLLEEAFSEGITNEVKFRVHTKNNKCIWLKLKADVYEHSEDKIIINAVLIDVTNQVQDEESLRMDEEEIRFALMQIGKTILIFNIDDKSLIIPEAYAKKHNFPSCKITAPDYALSHGYINNEDAISYCNFYSDIIAGKSDCSTETRVLCADGTWAFERAEAATIHALSGKPVKAIISIEDITQSRNIYDTIATEKANEEKRAKEYERLLFDATAEKYSSIVKINSESGKLTQIIFDNGILTEQSLAQKWNEYYGDFIRTVHHEERQSVSEILLDGRLENISIGAGTAFTYRKRNSNGDYRWYTTTLRSSDIHQVGSGRVITAFTMDINNEMTERERLRKLSEHDGLTELYNRVKYENMLKSDYKCLRTCGVLFLDVNYLKIINDTKGHEAGNELLCLVADSIKPFTGRRIHGYRYGGDEFLVIFCNADEDELNKLLSDWREKLNTLSASHDILCSVAAGKAWGEAPISVEALVNEADEAMYKNKDEIKAKDAERNCLNASR